MPWLNSVQDRTLQEIYQHADAKKQLMEALRWRGFPAVAAAGQIQAVSKWTAAETRFPAVEAAAQIQLVHASPVTDSRDLRVLGEFGALFVTPSQMPEAPDLQTLRAQVHAALAGEQPTPLAIVPCATVGWQSAVDEETRHQTLAAILRLGSPQGMTTSGSHPDYGYFLPSAELDQGIALLARSMALLGLRTFLSGHGRTEQCRLFVSFDDQSSANRFRDLFDGELRPRLRPDAGDMFTFQAHHAHEEFLIGHPTNDPAEAVQFFTAAKQLGSVILDNLPELRCRP
jgi:hypothetical protein